MVTPKSFSKASWNSYSNSFNPLKRFLSYYFLNETDLVLLVRNVAFNSSRIGLIMVGSSLICIILYNLIYFMSNHIDDMTFKKMID